MSRKPLLTVLATALTAAALTLAPAAAHAYSWSPMTTVWRGLLSSYCVKARAGIDHRSVGFSGNIAYAEAYALGVSVQSTCTAAHYGLARVRLDVQYWNGSTWTPCRATGWKVGITGWSGGEFPGPTGPQILLDYGGPSCGVGYYRTIAYAEFGGATGTDWVGGSVASPYEYVP